MTQKGCLPEGYGNKYSKELLALMNYFELLPEAILLLLDDETTADLTVDDDGGVSATCIPADANFPITVYINAPELAEPERREEIVRSIGREFRPLMKQLKGVKLRFQVPADS